MSDHVVPIRLDILQAYARRAVEAETELHVLKVVAGNYLQASTLGSYEEQGAARQTLEELLRKPWPGEEPPA